MGVAGCGKSTLGAALAHACGLPLIEGDEFHSQASRDKMHRGVALTDADRDGWLESLGRELRRHPGGAVLTCSALKRAYRDRLRAASPGLRFVFLDIDRAHARQRVSHRSTHFFSATLVDSQFATLESPVGEPGVLRVDALAPLDRLLAEVRAWLDGPGAPMTDSGATSRFQRVVNLGMAACLAVMAIAVFINVVLRYGFGSGVAASEELSRLLFVWMVFIGATAAYPAGEHMAFTSLVGLLRSRPHAMAAMTLLIRLLVLLACVLVGWGAWLQVIVGTGSHSVVLGYSAALLPLPALLSSVAIGAMALAEIVRRTPLDLGHGAEVE